MDQVDYLCDLALKFAAVNRTWVQLYNGQQESDTDHTVMLGWVACQFAAKWYPDMDLGLIAQLALVHDAPEVYAGDVQSLGMSADVAAIKKQNEELAVKRIESETTGWFIDTIKLYEAQVIPESRFVRALDKVLPKVVVWLNDLKVIAEHRSWEELQDQCNSQYNDLRIYAGEFTELMELYKQTAFRVIKGVHRLEIENSSRN